MSWYEEKGPMADVVVSTRCRYARNLSGYNFPSKMTLEEREKLISEFSEEFFNINSAFKNEFNLVKTKDFPKEKLSTLFEKHLVSRDLLRSPLPSGAIINKEETVSIMLCEEDHVRLQVILPGNQMEQALKIASDYDRLLDERLNFSKNERLGYLTACPTNLGTGLRVSVMLHLPALTITKKIGQLLNSVGKLGLTIRGMYGEGTEAKGSFYQLSNQITLGISDLDILKKVESVLNQIITIEKKLRSELLKRNETEIKNRTMRALGILRNSYSITSEEALIHLSDVRMGIALSILDLSYETITKFLVTTSPSYLISEKGIAEPQKRDVLRAEEARKILK